MSEIAVREDGDLTPAGTLFGTDNPGEVVERASKVARTLAEVVRSQKLIVRIGQSDHVRVEGWTFLGSLLGVFPVVEWTRPVLEGEQNVGWEARVEARTKSGEVVGAAEAECLRHERTWKGRDDYALRSMAQTRAVSKALRLPLGFVMQLAGFNPTPAEEMAVISGEVVEDREFPPVDANGEIVAPGSKPVITAAQRKRLWTIATDANVTEERLRELVAQYAGVESTKLIPRDCYEPLCEAVIAEVFSPPEETFEERAARAQATRDEAS